MRHPADGRHCKSGQKSDCIIVVRTETAPGVNRGGIGIVQQKGQTSRPAHAAAAPHTAVASNLLLRLLGDHGFSRNEPAGDGGRILQHGTNDLGRVEVCAFHALKLFVRPGRQGFAFDAADSRFRRSVETSCER